MPFVLTNWTDDDRQVRGVFDTAEAAVAAMNTHEMEAEIHFVIPNMMLDDHLSIVTRGERKTRPVAWIIHKHTRNLKGVGWSWGREARVSDDAVRPTMKGMLNKTLREHEKYMIVGDAFMDELYYTARPCEWELVPEESLAAIVARSKEAKAQ
jgi:hypothetical protein